MEKLYYEIDEKAMEGGTKKLTKIFEKMGLSPEEALENAKAIISFHGHTYRQYNQREQEDRANAES